MQPLKTMANPNSESIIGCCDAAARSMMLSLRWPNATRSCENVPPASGPRDHICADIAAIELSAALPLKVTSPQMPHISSLSRTGTPHRPATTLWRTPSSCTSACLRFKRMPHLNDSTFQFLREQAADGGAPAGELSFTRGGVHLRRKTTL